MRNDTRLAFHAYIAAIAKLNGIGNAAEKFTVDPSVQQTLENRLTESSAFLGKINVIGVSEQQGQKLGLGVGSLRRVQSRDSGQSRDTTRSTNQVTRAWPRLTN